MKRQEGAIKPLPRWVVGLAHEGEEEGAWEEGMCHNGVLAILRGATPRELRSIL